MARALSAEMLAAIAANVLRPVMIVKIATKSGDVNVWTGRGTLTFQSESYFGVGHFGGVSQIQETQEIQAAGMSFTLSGVPATYVSAVMGDMQYGREASCWFGLLNTETNAMISTPYKVFSGFTDVPAIEDGPTSLRITINAENALMDLERSRVRRYTTEDQKIDDPTDKGFDQVQSLQDLEILWGSQ